MRGPCLVNPASGNLVARIKTPAGGTFDPLPVLTYNSSYSSSASDFGAGWLGAYNRHVTNFIGESADLVTGEGTTYHYTDRNPRVLSASMHESNRLVDYRCCLSLLEDSNAWQKKQ